MLTVLSPAKKLDLEPHDYPGVASEPSLTSHTTILARAAKKLSVSDLQTLMKLSDNLAELNAERFKAFRLNGRSNSSKPAMLTFNGNVYEGLDAGTMSLGDIDFAQDHVRILSGLYGVLKPMDKIQPYRLEMGLKLKTKKGKTLYQFWGEQITDALNSMLAKQDDPVLINLASNEYFKSIQKKNLDCRLITPQFKDWKNGKYKMISFFAKKARGLMSSYIIKNRVKDIAGLVTFEHEGYRFSKKDSTEKDLVFLRKQS